MNGLPFDSGSVFLQQEHFQEKVRYRQRVRPKTGPTISPGEGGIRFPVRKCKPAVPRALRILAAATAIGKVP
jgi:hypothetical protein